MLKNKTTLFIVPRSSSAWKGSEALWVTIAGWSAAAKLRFGNAIVLTTDRSAEPHELLEYPLNSNYTENTSGLGIVNKLIPTMLKTFIKDILLWRKSKSKKRFDYNIPYKKEDLSFVWEHHDFFPGIGYKLAKENNVPLVKYVHAPQVWEAKKWGVKRPVWGKILESIEANSLKKADVVACVSPKVVDKLVNMGISKERILVSPMAVDPFLFQNIDSKEISKYYSLSDKFVIGWTGSFRSFHGLDILLKTFKEVVLANPSVRLMLVGDGFEKANMMKLAKDLKIHDSVIFTGKKSFKEIPLYVDIFDIAIVSASKVSDFHYSPLKLREYLGAGIPTLAPNAGEIPDIFINNKHLKLYNVGEIEQTANIILKLINSSEDRLKIGEHGKQFIFENGTWDVELEKVLAKINSLKLN